MGTYKKGYYLVEEILENDLKTSRVKIRKNVDFHSFELRRILQSECYALWNSTENYKDHISTYDLKYLFRIDNYNEKHFTRNIDRLYLAAHKDKGLTQFIDAMRDLLKERKIIKGKKMNKIVMKTNIGKISSTLCSFYYCCSKCMGVCQYL